jgi:type II secretory pathway pseudopilin PulG
MQFTIYNLQFTNTKHARKELFFQKGQSLFELVVAIAISALVIVTLVSLATNSIRNSSYSNNKARAATYTQQATEWLRGQRDNDIVMFKTYTAVPAYCLQDLGWTHPASNPVSDCSIKINGTIFNRWVTFNTSLQGGKTVIEADVVVSWIDSQGSHEVKSATNFSDWRQR